MCTYNGSRYLREQLTSILGQTHKIDEIVICDDNSSDDTPAIIEAFRQQYPGIITFHRNVQNIGAIRNFENAISLCQNEIIFLSDQDDIWRNDKVEIMVNAFLENKDALLIFSNAAIIDSEGNATNKVLWSTLNPPFDNITRNKWRNNRLAFEDLLLNENKVTGATVAFRSKLKKYTLPFVMPKEYWHDCWLALHASILEGLFFIDSDLIKYRLHANQHQGVTGHGTYDPKFSTTSFVDFIKSLKKQHPRFFLARSFKNKFRIL
jgi:glycosyltransferase involved in cell wall biosynthesis